jgi:hypothetical protein
MIFLRAMVYLRCSVYRFKVDLSPVEQGRCQIAEASQTYRTRKPPQPAGFRSIWTKEDIDVMPDVPSY